MKTVVGLFDDFAQAKKAALDLEGAGIPHSDISFIANNENGQYAPTTTDTGVSDTGHAVGHDAVVGAEIGGVAGLVMGLTAFAIPGFGWIAGAGWFMGMLMGAGVGAVAGGLVGALTHIGVPETDASYYNEGVRRGGTLLAIKAQDAVADKVAGILGDDGAVDIEERAEEYKQDGFVPTPQTPAYTPAPAPNTATAARAGETVLPVVAEELKVGKREVEGGGVRVYSHVTETPVEETVNLHEEHVSVDRRPADRPADQTAFQEKSFEMRETSEQPVVAKETRVVEEVVLNKEATDRTETVRDTVRRTDVDVEPLTTARTDYTTATPANNDPAKVGSV